MDPQTEIRHGPRIPKIPLSERQFINQAQIRKLLELYSGIERKSHHGTWKLNQPTMTSASFRQLRNELKDGGQRELSVFLSLINEPGNST